MRFIHHAAAAVLAAFVTASVASTAGCTPSPSAAPVLTVTANDDVFALSAPTIRPGVERIHLLSNGIQPHQATIVRLRAGHTGGEFLADLKAHNIPGALALIGHYSGGVVTVGPHGRADAYVSLTAGSYVVLCFVGDATTGVPHFAMGMAATLSVAGAPRPSALPRAAATVESVDEMRYSIPGKLTAGSMIRFVNRSKEDVHEFSLVRLLPGATLSSIKAWAKTEHGRPPFLFLGGAAAVSPGGVVEFSLMLRPGTYAVLCLVPDAKTGVAHAASGMESLVTVVAGPRALRG